MVFNLLATRPSDEEIAQRLRTLRDAPAAESEKRSFALEHLVTTDSAAIRNAAALALADLKALDSVPVIVDVLRKPGVSAAGGTLLYAIEELGGDLPLDCFVHVLLNGSYEARQQALDLLASGQVIGEEDGLERHLAELQELLSSEDREMAAAAEQALAMLQDGPESDGSPNKASHT